MDEMTKATSWIANTGSCETLLMLILSMITSKVREEPNVTGKTISSVDRSRDQVSEWRATNN